MPSEKLNDLRQNMSVAMDDILRCFKPGATITVIVRNPSPDADVIIGNDDLDAVIVAINTLKTSTPVFEAGKDSV